MIEYAVFLLAMSSVINVLSIRNLQAQVDELKENLQDVESDFIIMEHDLAQIGKADRFASKQTIAEED